jgi:hypothetical protein
VSERQADANKSKTKMKDTQVKQGQQEQVRLGKPSATARAQELIGDPSCSDWLKGALVALLKRDPLDAEVDALTLLDVMVTRTNEIFAKHGLTREVRWEAVPRGWAEVES